MAILDQVPSHSRFARILAIAGGSAVTAIALSWAVGSPVGVLRALVQPVHADFEILLTNAVGLAAWLCLGWFCAVLALELAAAVPGSGGRVFGTIAATVTPRVMRKLAQGLIGLSVLAGPLSAGHALAAAPVVTTSAPVALLDRPGSALVPHEAVNLATNASEQPVDLDRPSKPFVPAAPAPASKSTPAGAAELLAGVAHREVADAAYVVRRGDALWDVAARHLGPQASAADVAREWPRWYAANRVVIGADPNLIRPGQVLTPPTS
jgi:hypothetical protein